MPDQCGADWMVRWDRPYRAVEIARNAPVADCPGQAPRFVQGKENFSYPERALVVLQPEPGRAQLELSADVAMFTAWLQARAAGDSKPETLYVRRFTPDYRVAFFCLAED